MNYEHILIDVADGVATLTLNRLVESRQVPPRVLSTAALNALRVSDWPGNLTQLENVVRTVALLAPSQEIGLSDVNNAVCGLDAPNECGIPDMCVPESTATLCAAQALTECGTASVVDRCGATRNLDCGACSGSEQCGTWSHGLCDEIVCTAECHAVDCGVQVARLQIALKGGSPGFDGRDDDPLLHSRKLIPECPDFLKGADSDPKPGPPDASVCDELVGGILQKV